MCHILISSFKGFNFMSKKSQFAISAPFSVWDLRVSMKHSSKTKERPVDPSPENNKVSLFHS